MGGNRQKVFHFKNPHSNSAFIHVLENHIVDINGNAWSGPVKIFSHLNGPQPWTEFDLYDTDEPEKIQFKIVTTFSN